MTGGVELEWLLGFSFLVVLALHFQKKQLNICSYLILESGLVFAQMAFMCSYEN
jgi:hypothetical protein